MVGLIDRVKVLRPTRHRTRSFRRRSSQPISWRSTKERCQKVDRQQTLSKAERCVDSEPHVTLFHEDRRVLGIIAPRAQPEVGAHRTAVIHHVEYHNEDAHERADRFHVRPKYLRFHLRTSIHHNHLVSAVTSRMSSAIR